MVLLVYLRLNHIHDFIMGDINTGESNSNLNVS